ASPRPRPFLLVARRPSASTLFPYTTLFRSLADLSNAAMAAACGAEAEVPKNGANPGTLVATPSAAVTSGFLRTWPPLPLNNRLRSEEHTSELQSLTNLVCRLLLEKKKRNAT